MCRTIRWPPQGPRLPSRRLSASPPHFWSWILVLFVFCPSPVPQLLSPGPPAQCGPGRGASRTREQRLFWGIPKLLFSVSFVVVLSLLSCFGQFWNAMWCHLQDVLYCTMQKAWWERRCFFFESLSAFNDRDHQTASKPLSQFFNEIFYFSGLSPLCSAKWQFKETWHFPFYQVNRNDYSNEAYF